MRSAKETSFANARSTSEMPGARKALRPRSPNVPAAGVENAAGLIHSCGVDPPGGVSGTPGTIIRPFFPADRKIARHRPVRTIDRDVERQPGLRRSDGAERPAAEYRPRNAGAAEIVLSRSEGQLVNGGEIEHLANVIVAARLIARSAEGILRRVGFAAADAAVVDRMRPHVIRREQEAVLKGSAGVELQRMEGAVANVAAPRNRTECRVRRNACQRIHQVDVSGGQNIRSFVSEIAGGCRRYSKAVFAEWMRSMPQRSRLSGCDPDRAAKRRPAPRLPRTARNGVKGKESVGNEVLLKE